MIVVHWPLDYTHLLSEVIIQISFDILQLLRGELLGRTPKPTLVLLLLLLYDPFSLLVLQE